MACYQGEVVIFRGRQQDTRISLNNLQAALQAVIEHSELGQRMAGNTTS